MVRVPDGTLRVLVQGLERVKLEKVEQTEPYLTGLFTKLPDVAGREMEVEALAHTVESLFGHIISMAPYLPEELLLAAANAESPSGLANLIASTLRLSTEQKQELLEAVDVEERLRKLTGMLSRELEVIELGTKIQSQVHEEMDKSQREYFLRQQLKAIQDELGEGDEQQAEITELRTRLDEAKLPEEADRAARRELDRLAKLPPAAAEYGVIRTYLEWLMSVPWTETTEDDLDLGAARAILDEDHYDLEKVKERILEHLAVQKLTNKLSGPILCFVGPPGVGKTSLGQSIARALGRKFVRVSVGGVRDESEIRGHRRTYVGAMPGTIIRALRDAEHEEPGLHDRRDRQDGRRLARRPLERDARGARPRPELELPRPLPRPAVRPLAGALHLHREPARAGPGAAARPHGDHPGGRLHGGREGRDRAHLPRPEAARGARARPEAGTISENALRHIVREYTREAGVRNLDRELAAICRKVAREIAEGKRKGARVDERRVRAWLGAPRFRAEVRRRTSDPGVATGLAVTPVGGDVLFVEATAMPGSGRLTITGQIGDVMRESAQAALSWVRVHSTQLGLASDWFEERDVHIHVPAGAVPKDGPSAGRRDGDRPLLAGHGRPGLRGRRDDRRDHADRPRAPDRGREGEGAGRGARRDLDRDPPASERARPRRPPEGRPPLDELRARGPDRGSARGRIPAGRGTRVSRGSRRVDNPGERDTKGLA